MKQPPFFQQLDGLLSKLELNHSYSLDGFHLDFFLSLYRALRVPAFILFPDTYFNNIIKFLSVLLEDRKVVFVPPGFKENGPEGFSKDRGFHIKRSKELLSSGLSSVSFVVCAESGLSIPLVGDDSVDQLDVFSSFDDFLDFFDTHNYFCVDIVLTAGEFCVRGGILDVFPFSSENPVRISFFEDLVEVWQFDVQSQLTIRRINNFSLSASRSKNLLQLKNSSLSGFISLVYCPDELLNIIPLSPFCFSKHFTSISFEEFIFHGGHKSNNVYPEDDLCSVGVMNNNNFFVPGWFVNARPPSVSSHKKVGRLPLNLTTIKSGDYLVHRDHGVGVCLGLQKHSVDSDFVQEFLSIKYEDGGIIRVDVGRLDLIDYFASADTDGVILDSLHKKALWSRKRKSARLHAEETVDYLLNMYVRRNNVSRSPFLPYKKLEAQFLKDFLFEDTDDQVSAWEEISNDLSSVSPMDRLLCGDVGFGKTEIAMRASFRVVLCGRRVLVLAPTTILVNQLYASFCSRLDNHAVNIDIVSRFRSTKNIDIVKKKILSKENDILIGTHSLLNDDIYMKNIGLLIIDEEHRFGVQQKEKIKCFKNSLDVLSMSATPIPRSLNLALSGIYSISLLQTPPLMRLPIITRVNYLEDRLIQNAISFEVERGGQVYFVHNNIQSIESMVDRLRRILPDMKIIFIHGQETPKRVENKMESFVSGEIHVLVCTSIIEAGIDVPNANCIIINNSHLLGLSQLYQIRGRVGRGSRQAYAYLLIPKGLNLSKISFDRIKTIEENTHLGSGYNISRSDMGLRGSGSLFGYKQSGGSGSVGYELYLRLIRRVLHGSGTLKTEFIMLPEDILIDIFQPCYIPENYISVENLRLSFYKSLSSASDDAEIDHIHHHITNRFGPPPLPVKNLFFEYRLRLLSARVGVLSIRFRGCGFVCNFIENDSPDFSSSFLEYVGLFMKNKSVDFHIFPPSDKGLFICLHISNETDKYLLLSSFLDKFKSLV